MPKMTGGCLCGAISYSVDAEPMFMGVCHCKDCQRSTGSKAEPVVALPDATFSMKGSPKSYASKGASGGAVNRSFCPECGSRLTARAETMPGVVMLLAGTMDDASQFKPAMQIFCDSAQPWVELGGQMQKFARMPGAPS